MKQHLHFFLVRAKQKLLRLQQFSLLVPPFCTLILHKDTQNASLHLHHPIAVAAPTVGGRETQAAHLAAESLERKTTHRRGTTAAKTVVQYCHSSK